MSFLGEKHVYANKGRVAEKSVNCKDSGNSGSTTNSHKLQCSLGWPWTSLRWHSPWQLLGWQTRTTGPSLLNLGLPPQPSKTFVSIRIITNWGREKKSLWFVCNLWNNYSVQRSIKCASFTLETWRWELLELEVANLRSVLHSSHLGTDYRHLQRN